MWYLGLVSENEDICIEEAVKEISRESKSIVKKSVRYISAVFRLLMLWCYAFTVELREQNRIFHH
jgi:hypothetical protein